MSKKKFFKGLKFHYRFNDNELLDKYETIEDFLNTSFPKNNNPLSPNLDTEIFKIVWNRHLLSDYIPNNIRTVKDLIDVLNIEDVYNTLLNKQFCEPKLKKSESKHKDLIRNGVYSIDEVRNKVKNVLFEKDKRNAKIDFDGDLIKGNSQRYQTFFTKGCKCVVCGIEGKYFAKERHLQDKTYHLNLYAVDDNGNEILMTKDHILPRSKGGIDDISNYQTMCKLCNEAKGNKLED